MNKNTFIYYQIFNGHGYDTRHFSNEAEAIEAAKDNKKRNKGDGYDEYWNSLTYTVQKVAVEDLLAIE